MTHLDDDQRQQTIAALDHMTDRDLQGIASIALTIYAERYGHQNLLLSATAGRGNHVVIVMAQATNEAAAMQIVRDAVKSTEKE